MTKKQVRILKTYVTAERKVEPGEIIWSNLEGAAELVKLGYAEYITPIPPQLESWRFILISPKSKVPPAEMKGWTKNRENMTFKHDEHALLTYVESGGNYAVVTGEDRFVLAADTKEVEQAIESRLPKTFTVISPRHKTKHFYYYGKITRYVEFKPTNKGDPCCDLKYGNAYVLGPDSAYENFGKYKIADENPIATTTEEAVLAALDEFIKTSIATPEETEEKDGSKLNPQLNFDITKILQNIDAFSQNGDTLTGPHPQHGSLTGSNFHINVKKNTWHCFRNGHDSGGGPLQLLAVMEGIIKCEECHKGALRGAKFQLAVAKAQELKLIPPLQVTPQSDEPAEDNEKLDISTLLYILNHQFTFKTPTDLEDIYCYDNGVYVLAEHKIKGLLETWLGAKATTHIINEILDHIQRSSFTNRSEFNKYKGLIPVQSGLLNLETQTLEPFSKNEIFTYKLNTDYKPESKCPKWLKFLSEILTPEDVPLLQEYLGYCLLPGMPYHVLMWLYGKGRNGKGRIMATIEAILGARNCAHLNTEEFSGDRRFSTAELYGKMINISSEPSTIKTLQTPLLKKLTGEDVIDAEVKNKQRRLSFLNTAKFFILGNRFPKINDATIAFWDRVLLIPFPKSFIGPERKINIEREWLEDPEEVSGILNWMIEGLHRLNRNKDFTKTSSTEETKLEFKRASDTVMSFIDEQCLYDKLQVYTREELYDIYKDYCDSYGLVIEEEKQFTSKIKQTPKIKSKFKKIDGKTTRIWVGVKVKPIIQEEEETTQNTLTNAPRNTEDTHDTHILGVVGIGGEISIDYKRAPKAVSGVPSVSSPICGDCLSISTGACEYPAGPDAVKPGFGWAVNCKGFKSKEVREES